MTPDTGPEAFTGTLDGRVVDAETGEALVGAHVWLVDLGLGDVVAADGQFAVPLLPTGRYVVRVSHVGYGPVRLELDVFPESSRLPPTVRLQRVIIDAPDAPVVAGPEPPGPTPGMTDLAGRQAAAIPYALGEADLAATLSWLPGLTRTGGASGALVVRGADPHRTRYVRDGVPLYEPWHAFGLFSSFQPEALARVRFHRGSLPAPLGGGLAAVLDVETTDALSGDTVRTVGLSAVAGRVVADVPVGGDVGVHLGLRRSVLGVLLVPGLRAEGGAWVLDPTGGDVLRRDRPPHVGFGDAALKVSARLAPHSGLHVAGTLGDDRVRLDLPLAHAGSMDYGWRTHTASARLQTLRGSRTLVTALGYRSGHAADEVRVLPDAVVQTNQRLVEHGVGLDVDHFRSLSHQVRGGVQLAHRTVSGTRRASSLDDADRGRQSVAEVAGYVQDSWRPSREWQLVPGLRAEALISRAGVSHLALSPRLFARWTPDEDRLVVRAGLSRQSQAVHRVRDRAAGRYALASSRWLLADDRIPVASAWQWGAGAEWAPGRVAFSADVYTRWSRGLLEPLGSTATPAGVRPGPLVSSHPPHSGRATGLELAARTTAGDWVLGLSGAVSRAQVRQAGEDWRPSAYDRPVALGVIAQRGQGAWTAALRLDAESGLAAEDGRRDPRPDPGERGGRRLGVAAGFAVDGAGAGHGASARPPASGRHARRGPATGDRRARPARVARREPVGAVVGEGRVGARLASVLADTPRQSETARPRTLRRAADVGPAWPSTPSAKSAPTPPTSTSRTAPSRGWRSRRRTSTASASS